MTGFLNLDEDGADTRIGDGLKGQPKRAKADRTKFSEVAIIGAQHGFTRGTGDRETAITSHRPGRPPLNQNMGYWRIYISPELRRRLAETSREP